MNMNEVLMGGLPMGESQPMANPQSIPQAQAKPNPFAGLLNIAKAMEEDPQGTDEKFTMLAQQGIRPPEFTADNFLEYIQNQQSARNQAVAGAGQGIPAQGASPHMPPPDMLNALMGGM